MKLMKNNKFIIKVFLLVIYLCLRCPETDPLLMMHDRQ